VSPRSRLDPKAGLSKLSELYLYHTDVSGAGMAHLSGLTNLSSLDLSRTRVTDAGLAYLKGLTRLSWLDLSHTQVSDAGLAHLKGLTNLRSLHLEGTKVTESGLIRLKCLTNLSGLHVDATQVIDARLAHLSGPTKAGYVELSAAQVTDAGAKELMRALPNLRIYSHNLPLRETHYRNKSILAPTDVKHDEPTNLIRATIRRSEVAPVPPISPPDDGLPLAKGRRSVVVFAVGRADCG
jgi:Leucine rich repeat